MGRRHLGRVDHGDQGRDGSQGPRSVPSITVGSNWRGKRSGTRGDAAINRSRARGGAVDVPQLTRRVTLPSDDFADSIRNGKVYGEKFHGSFVVFRTPRSDFGVRAQPRGLAFHQPGPGASASTTPTPRAQQRSLEPQGGPGETGRRRRAARAWTRASSRGTRCASPALAPPGTARKARRVVRN